MKALSLRNTRRSAEPGARARHGIGLRWPLIGALIGTLVALIAFAPASWLARGLASATQEQLLLTDTRGTVWQGSGVLVLSGGTGSRDFSTLPGRLEWSLGLQQLGLILKLRQACCINGEMQLLLQPGFGRLAISVPAQGDWQARWPAAWLSGLGTPWNTLQLSGSVRLTTRELRLDWVQGRWRQSGAIQLDFINLASRVATIAPLGSYRLNISGDPASGASQLQLSTMEGALLLNGAGTLGGAAKARFLGEASAAPGREAALNNLLNIIGRRNGARSVISIG
jgi:general secretion pathway protein N